MKLYECDCMQTWNAPKIATRHLQYVCVIPSLYSLICFCVQVHSSSHFWLPYFPQISRNFLFLFLFFLVRGSLSRLQHSRAKKGEGAISSPFSFSLKIRSAKLFSPGKINTEVYLSIKPPSWGIVEGNRERGDQAWYFPAPTALLMYCGVRGPEVFYAYL